MENNEPSKFSADTSTTTTPVKETSLTDRAKSICAVESLRFKSLSKILNLDDIDRELQIPTIDYITDKAGAIVAEYFAAFSLGALLGAAITTGMLCGTFFATTLLNRHFSFPYTFFSSRRKQEASNPTSQKSEEQVPMSLPNVDVISSTCKDDGIIIPPSKAIVILNGVASSTNKETEKSIKHEYKSCLDNLSINLSKRNLTWNNVIKIRAYLVILDTEKTHSTEFRSLVNQYLYSKDTIVNIVYVPCLENEAIIQIELFATD